MTYLNSIRSQVRVLFKDGLLHVVGAGTISKVISLCSGLVIVRILSKSEYGIYSYVLNIVNVIMITDGLGTQTGIIQYGCEYCNDEKKQRSVVRYGFSLGLVFNVVLSAMIVFYSISIPKAIQDTDIYFIFTSLIPVFNYVVCVQLGVLRIREENKLYGIVSSLNSVLLFSSIILGAYICSIGGAIYFRYVALLIIILLGFLLYPQMKYYLVSRVDRISGEIRRGFIKFSLFSCANNSISHLFYTADLFLIGELIKNSEIVAGYKVATTVPMALTFLTASIITYIYPKFVKHKDDYCWLKVHVRKLTKLLLILNGVIAMLMIVFAPSIIKIVFGMKYVESSTLEFRVLMVGFFITATFRIPTGNILDMLHLIKPNLIISIICGVINIIADVILIKIYGCIGAAIATTVTYLIYAVLSKAILSRYLNMLKHNADAADKTI